VLALGEGGGSLGARQEDVLDSSLKIDGCAWVVMAALAKDVLMALGMIR
jgi:hypothetical protein